MFPNEDTTEQVFAECLLDPLTLPKSKPTSWQRQKRVYLLQIRDGGIEGIETDHSQTIDSKVGTQVQVQVSTSKEPTSFRGFVYFEAWSCCRIQNSLEIVTILLS